MEINLRNITRFVIAGSVGAGVHLGLLTLLVEVYIVPVLAATTCAFIAAVCVSFTLQKYWTFKNLSHEQVISQALRYTAIALINLGINALLMHALVNQLQMHYLAGQIITSGLIALESFILYRLVVFPATSDSKNLA